jgi:lactose/L-arabinose transport system substrate-binding protein
MPVRPRAAFARLIGAATIAATLVAGCATGGGGGAGGGAGSALASTAAPAAVSGNVTVWSWDVAAAALKKVVPAFEKQYPKVKVKVVDIGYDNAYDKISVGLQAGHGLPDVVTVETDHMAGYIGTFPNGFVNLAPAADPMKADFDPTKWAASTDAKGHLYSLPWDDGPVGLFYRRDYFAAAHVDPASIKTWGQMVAAGKQIKAATGKQLLVADVTNGDSLFPMLLQQQGASYFTEDGKVSLDSPQALKALQLEKTLQDAGLIDNEKGWDGLVSATKAGKAAAQPIAVWWTGTLTSEMPKLSGKFGVIPLPAFEPGGATTSNNGGSTLAIPSQSKHAKAAWAFIKFALADKANAVAMMKDEGLFPSYLPALSDPYFQAPQPYFAGQPIYRLFGEDIKNIPPFVYTSDSTKASDVVNNMVAGVLLNGKNPQAALSDAAKQIANATNRKLAGS